MKSAHIFRKGEADIEVKVQDVPVPTPAEDQVLVKVCFIVAVFGSRLMTPIQRDFVLTDSRL